ncbi:unnamed protein product, partial [Choristocarpus tenellus]
PPPRELFRYIRPGTRKGVLAALGTAQRSAGQPLGLLLSGATPGERDALRAFLAREPVSEMLPEEVAVCRALPILPLHADGLELAMSTDSAATSSAAPSHARGEYGGVDRAGLNPPIAAKTSVAGGGQGVKGPGVCSAYAAANERQLFILLEVPIDSALGIGAFTTHSGDEGSVQDRPDPLKAQATSAVPWRQLHLLTQDFVRFSGTGGSGNMAEVALAERLGARRLGRGSFFVDHVFSRLGSFPSGLRDSAMSTVLLEAPSLLQQDRRFRESLEALAFVPAGDKVIRPRDLFDPEVPELPNLLPASRFPSGAFAHPDILAGLRPLGLKGSLGWDGIVEAAVFIEELAQLGQGRAGAGGGGVLWQGKAKGEVDEGKRKLEAASARGRAL